MAFIISRRNWLISHRREEKQWGYFQFIREIIPSIALYTSYSICSVLKYISDLNYLWDITWKSGLPRYTKQMNELMVLQTCHSSLSRTSNTPRHSFHLYILQQKCCSAEYIFHSSRCSVLHNIQIIPSGYHLHFLLENMFQFVKNR